MEFTEYDCAGKITARVRIKVNDKQRSDGDDGDDDGNLVMLGLRPGAGAGGDGGGVAGWAWEWAGRGLNIFLPAGYPGSVTEDYAQYQIYDSLQAFSSSIAGLLTSRAVLEGFGVGDANASATSALLLSILQNSIGRIATIFFAHRFGIALESECKKYRFAADIFNDSAMILDWSLRALCGVAGGGSKASLSVHFAKGGNVGDLNAKDSSQETVISLMGMLSLSDLLSEVWVGSFVVSHITSTIATWTALLLLLSVHLATNYVAVSAVALRTLNRQRANIVFSQFIDSGAILTPKEVSKRELIFETDGVLRWGKTVVGCASIGVGLSPFLEGITKAEGDAVRFPDLAKVFQDETHMLWYERGRRRVSICLAPGITSIQILRAWFHALLVAKRLHRIRVDGSVNKVVLEAVREGLRDLGADARFDDTAMQLKAAGWDLGTAALETKPGYRVQKLTGSEADSQGKKKV